MPLPRIEALGSTGQAGQLDLPVALYRPRDQDDVTAIVGHATATVPALLVLARDISPGAPVSVAIAAVGSSAGCVVVTWVDDAPAGSGAGGSPAMQAWAIHADALPPVLLRRLRHGSDPAAAPAATRGAERTVAPTRMDLKATSPGVLLDPLVRELGLAPAFDRLRTPPPTNVEEPAALLVARPTATGRRAGSAAVRALKGGLRIHVTLPLDPGPAAWGPRGPEAADVLLVPRAEGERCEWLLRLE